MTAKATDAFYKLCDFRMQSLSCIVASVETPSMSLYSLIESMEVVGQESDVGHLITMHEIKMNIIKF